VLKEIMAISTARESDKIGNAPKVLSDCSRKLLVEDDGWRGKGVWRKVDGLGKASFGEAAGWGRAKLGEATRARACLVDARWSLWNGGTGPKSGRHGRTGQVRQRETRREQPLGKAVVQPSRAAQSATHMLCDGQRALLDEMSPLGLLLS
jgi:hypothetical protein